MLVIAASDSGAGWATTLRLWQRRVQRNVQYCTVNKFWYADTYSVGRLPKVLPDFGLTKWTLPQAVQVTDS